MTNTTRDRSPRVTASAQRSRAAQSEAKKFDAYAARTKTPIKWRAFYDAYQKAHAGCEPTKEHLRFIVWSWQNSLPFFEPVSSAAGAASHDERTTASIEAWFCGQVLLNGVEPSNEDLHDWAASHCVTLPAGTRPRAVVPLEVQVERMRAFLREKRPRLDREVDAICYQDDITPRERLDRLYALLDRSDKTATGSQRVAAMAHAQSLPDELVYIMRMLVREYHPSEHDRRLSDLLTHAHRNHHHTEAVLQHAAAAAAAENASTEDAYMGRVLV